MSLPSDNLQHIQFEGRDVVILAPEDYDVLVADLAIAKALFCDIEAVDKPPDGEWCSPPWSDLYDRIYAWASDAPESTE